MTASMLTTPDRSRRLRSAVATGFMILSFVIMLVPLVLIVGYVLQRGAGMISWHFLKSNLQVDSSILSI